MQGKIPPQGLKIRKRKQHPPSILTFLKQRSGAGVLGSLIAKQYMGKNLKTLKIIQSYSNYIFPTSFLVYLTHGVFMIFLFQHFSHFCFLFCTLSFKISFIISSKNNCGKGIEKWSRKR